MRIQVRANSQSRLARLARVRFLRYAKPILRKKKPDWGRLVLVIGNCPQILNKTKQKHINVCICQRTITRAK